jgi:hypothetical protein
MTLDEAAPDWALQLATYGWLCGAEVGANFITAIDQLCFNKQGALRVAEHRCRINSEYQVSVYSEYCSLDSIIKSGWIFRDMSETESARTAAVLDKVYVAYQGNDPATRWLKECSNLK